MRQRSGTRTKLVSARSVPGLSAGHLPGDRGSAHPLLCSLLQTCFTLNTAMKYRCYPCPYMRKQALPAVSSRPMVALPLPCVSPSTH